MKGPATTRIWTILEIVRVAAAYLAERGVAAARLDAEVLLGHVLGLERVSLYVQHDRPLTAEEVTSYRAAVAARAKRVPIALITGEREFLSRPFHIRPGVLIPRPETEVLVEAVTERLRDSNDSPTLVDVGTGSGAIAVSLALGLPAWRVVATDISPVALQVTQENALRHGVADRLDICRRDLLGPEPQRDTGPVQAVVSNPPYVPTGQWAGLAPEITDHEPREALVAGDDGLAVYRRLIPAAVAILTPGGLLALEVGAGQAGDVVGIMDAVGGLTVEAPICDLAGHARVLCAWRVDGGEGAG